MRFTEFYYPKIFRIPSCPLISVAVAVAIWLYGCGYRKDEFVN